jgi:cystathionine gamma-synthase
VTLDPSTRAAHAGSSREHGAPSSPPIHTASFYVSDGDPTDLPFAYGRNGNATWEALERGLGTLEDARSVVFSSGLAASFALLFALTDVAKKRTRVILPKDGYYGTRRQSEMVAGRGVEPIAIDLADLELVQRELARGPSVLWAETPTNPLLRVFDLAALARLAREFGAPLVVDNTTATAALQRPLEFGATATVCSLTKSVSGHSDVILGAVATRDNALAQELATWRSNAGSIPGPFEAWLALRGLKTLPLRIERASANALDLAKHLGAHKRVRAVHYPGLDDRTAALARAQMRAGGPLLSFELDGDRDAADRVVAAARVIRPGTSFGGVESSWERRARWASETAPESLIRISVGIEAFADLVADVDNALSAR